MKTFYTELSRYYDRVFAYDGSEAALTLELAGRERTSLKVLEIGCGTGRLAVDLALRGFETAAVDLDPKMVERTAARALESGVELFTATGDMSKPLDLPPDFRPDLILVLGNTLVHLPDRTEITAFFSRCRELLAPGGQMMIQILNYDFIESHGVKELPLIEREGIRFERAYAVEGEQIRFSTALTPPEGERLKNSVLLYPLKQKEMADSLIKAGFSLLQYSGSFSYSDFRQVNIEDFPEGLPVPEGLLLVVLAGIVQE